MELLKSLSLIVVVGPSGSGKDSLFPTAVVTHTTRTARVGEVDGIDYHFEDEFVDSTDVVAHGCYNGNHYWSTKEDLNNGGSIIVEPSGVDEIVNSVSIPVVVVVVTVPENVRYQRMISRGDGYDKAIDRINTDRQVFEDVEDIADVIIYNG